MGNHATDCEMNGYSAVAELWRDEADRMQRSGEDIPFKGKKLPAAMTRILQPYQQELESHYCAAMAEFELGSIKRKGFIGFRTD